MQKTEIQPITLDAEEWEIISELLQREVRHLPLEIRHTDVRAAREALHEQLRKTEALLNKLTPMLEEYHG
jgi:hypothetical protein